MAKETEHCFPIGRVAATLRKILSPDLSNHDVEAISVCLMAHLLVERAINETPHAWLLPDAPKYGDEAANKKSDEALWTAITKMDFSKKFSLIQPHFILSFPGLEKRVWQINDLRNEIFHGRALKDAKFEGKPISDEKTVEQIFVWAQDISMQMDKFQELTDRPHALAERWSKRLRELDAPLM